VLIGAIKLSEVGSIYDFKSAAFCCVLRWCVGRPGSIVGIVTGYGLDGPGIESWWGTRFSTPVQTSPGAHPASCTIGTRSFPGVKSSGCMTLTPHSLLVPWSWKSIAVLLLPLWAIWPVQSFSACTRVHFTILLRWCREADPNVLCVGDVRHMMMMIMMTVIVVVVM
jgi:hypothetical protein